LKQLPKFSYATAGVKGRQF